MNGGARGVADAGRSREAPVRGFFSVCVRGDMGSRLLVACLAQGSGEPLETLVQTVTGGGASGLDVLLGKRLAGGQGGSIMGL